MGPTSYSFDFSAAVLPSGTRLERASSGTRFNSSGLLVSEMIDVARFDYDPSTLMLLGLLVEPQRTNTVRSSENITTSGVLYNIQNASISVDATIAPDGEVSAEKLVPNTTDSTVHLVQAYWQGASGFTPTAGVKYCSSQFVKAAGYNFIQMVTNNTFSGGTHFCYFDLATGAFGDYGAGYMASDLTKQDVGGGWWRTSQRWIGKATPAIYDSCWGIRPVVVFNSTTPSYAGDGTSGVLSWGWQTEVGDYPTSYIPNTSTVSAATRAADVLKLDVADGYWDVEVTTPNGTFNASGLAVSGGAGYQFDWADFNGATTERHLLSAAFTPAA